MEARIETTSEERKELIPFDFTIRIENAAEAKWLWGVLNAPVIPSLRFSNNHNEACIISNIADISSDDTYEAWKTLDRHIRKESSWR